MTEDERKLLDILDSDEVTPPGLAEALEAAKVAFPDADPADHEAIAGWMLANMPTSQEIQQAADIAEHNAAVDQARNDRLASRKGRRNKRKRS